VVLLARELRAHGIERTFVSHQAWDRRRTAHKEVFLAKEPIGEPHDVMAFVGPGTCVCFIRSWPRVGSKSPSPLWAPTRGDCRTRFCQVCPASSRSRASGHGGNWRRVTSSVATHASPTRHRVPTCVRL